MFEIITVIAVIWAVVSVVVVGCCVSAAQADRDALRDGAAMRRRRRSAGASKLAQRVTRSTRPAA